MYINVRRYYSCRVDFDLHPGVIIIDTEARGTYPKVMFRGADFSCKLGLTLWGIPDMGYVQLERISLISALPWHKVDTFEVSYENGYPTFTRPARVLRIDDLDYMGVKLGNSWVTLFEVVEALTPTKPTKSRFDLINGE